jgi:hypothetical protein
MSDNKHESYTSLYKSSTPLVGANVDSWVLTLKQYSLMLLIDRSKAAPAVFLWCVSLLLISVLVTLLFVSLVVFSSTESIFPFAPSFISLIYSPLDPSPNLLSPSPMHFYLVGLLCLFTLWAYYSNIYLFPLIFLSVTNYFFLCIILVNSLSVLSLAPCLVFVGDSPGLLAAGSCCWVV